MKEKIKFVGMAMAFFFPLFLLMGTIFNVADIRFNMSIFPGMPDHEVTISAQWSDIFTMMLMLFVCSIIMVIYEYIKEKKKGVNQK